MNVKLFSINIWVILFTATISLAEVACIENWNEMALPNDTSSFWKNATRSNDDWQVLKTNDNVIATKKVYTKKIQKHKLKMGCRYLIGTNGGEFGGKLFLTSDSNLFKPQQKDSILLSENIQGLLFEKDNGLVFAGSSHQGLRYGVIYLLSKHCLLNLLIRMKDTPLCFVSDTAIDAVYIVTTQRILQIHNKQHIKCIKEIQFAKWVIPNSIIKQNNYLFIGMRAGILKVNLTDPNRSTWLLPIEK